MNSALQLKNLLLSDIHQMALQPELCAKNPEKDFTRKRKLPLEELLKFFLFMERDTLSRELQKYFDYDPQLPSASAFCQQFNKLKPGVFRKLLMRFNSHFSPTLYKDKYVLTAVDGSGFSIFRNPEDESTFIANASSERGYNQVYIVAAYTLQDRMFTDAIITPNKSKHEHGAICDLMQNHTIKQGIPLFLADRGFPSYNLIAHAKEDGCAFLVRAKQLYVERLLKQDLPEEDEFDVTVKRIVTRSSSKKARKHPELNELYKWVDPSVRFDYLPPGSKDEYPLEVRVVRVKIPSFTPEGPDSYEYLITNLPDDEFDLSELCLLYHLRWGIETSFRELKHAVGAVDFHRKSVESVTQELWARILLYNFSSRIIALANVNNAGDKYEYQPNYTMSIKVCRDFLRQCISESPLDVIGLIEKHKLPVRPNRKSARHRIFQKPLNQCYRH